MDQDELLEELSIESSKSILGGLGGKALNYALVVLLARYLQPAGYGLYATGFMLASVLTTVSQLGLESGMARHVSKAIGESRPREVADVFLVATGTAVGVSLVLVGAAVPLAPMITDLFLAEGDVVLLLLFLLSVPFRVCLVVTRALFQGFNDMSTHVGIRLGRDGLQVLVAAGLVILGAGIHSVVFGMVAVIAVFGLATAGLSVRKLSKIGATVDISRLRAVAEDLLVYSLPLWFVAIANLGMNWADILLLSYFLSSEVVGIYQSAYSLSSGLWILLLTFSTPFFPMASRLYTNSNLDQLESLFQLVTRWINLVMLPVFVFSVVFAGPIVTLIFGDAYAAGAFVLQILLVGSFVHVASGNNVVLLKSSDNTQAYLVIAAATMVLNIVLNVTLIPPFEAVGAAVATSLSMSLLNVGVVVFVYYRFDIWGYGPLRAYVIYLLSAAVALLPVIAVESVLEVNTVLLSLVYAGLYFLVIRLQGGFTEADRKVVRIGVDFLRRS